MTRRLHVAFVAPTREQVDECWRAGTDAGYESDGPPGVIHHSLDWIAAQCAARDLVVSELDQDRWQGQFWLAIKRGADGAALFNGEPQHHATSRWPWR